LVNDELCVANLKYTFVLDKDAQLFIYKWFKSHVFMQILIPITYRDLLPKGI